jgi:outer membrane protein, heavy metal efflux system
MLKRFDNSVGCYRVGFVLALVVLCVSGCQTPTLWADRSRVSTHLNERMDQSLPTGTPLGAITMPPGAALEDGVTDDEAISMALWNNPAFQELLVDLGLARGDLIQAGLLPNPEFVYFFNVPEKPFKYALELPIEALWLRPIRVRAAEREAERTSERLTQAGLDLIRDVRAAYADVLLAKERVRVAQESVKLRSKLAAINELRLTKGDFSAQEAATTRIDALTAEQDTVRIAFEVPIAEERLKNLMGIGSIREPLKLDPDPAPPMLTLDIDALTQQAMARRPDALAAAQLVAAAQARLRFAEIGWVRLLGVLDATSGRNTGHEFGPGFRFTIPIFNRNQGNIARAQAELEKAERNQQTVANQIILDVQRSYLQYRQACAELDMLRTRVRPEVETAIRRAQTAYQEGTTTIFIVLETTRQLLDNALRDAVLTADLRRFWAELERSVGRRLTPPISTNLNEVPAKPVLTSPSSPKAKP